MNGGVERCNGAWRYEFYAASDLPSTAEQLNPLIDSVQHLHNHHRPHGAPGGLTPHEYPRATKAAKTSLSQMTERGHGIARRPNPL